MKSQDQKTQDAEEQYLNFSLIGGWFSFIQAFSVIFAIVGYFIWPHVFPEHDIQKIYEGIQQNPLGYFMKLDPIVLIGTLFQLPVWFALWAVLRQFDKVKSTLALAIGLISVVASLTIRPIIEMYSLSSLYALADSTELQNIYIAAGESLFSVFHGTSWAVCIMSGGLAAILFASVMGRSGVFTKATFWTMLLSGIGALPVLIPTIGILSLFFLGTILGVIGSIFCGIDLLQYYNRNRKRIV